MKSAFRNDYVFGVFWIAVVIVTFFLPVVLGRQVLFEALPSFFDHSFYSFDRLKTPWVIDGGTYVRATVPDTIQASRMIDQGIAPLWTPYSAAGQPLAVNMASGIYNPLRALFFSLFHSARAFDFYILLHLFVAGFGMFTFLHALGIDRRAGLLGGIAYMCSGYFMTNLTFWFLGIDALTPYVFWGFERYFRAPNAKRVAAAGMLLALIVLGSHPEVTVVVSLFVGGYILARLVTDKDLRSAWKFHLTRLFGIAAIAGLIALPFFFDLGTLLSQGYTVHEPPIADFATQKVGAFSFGPVYFLHFIVSPSMVLETALGGHVYASPQQFVPYVGIGIVLLALYGLFVARRNSWIYFFPIFLVIAAMKLGGVPPVSLIGHFPLFNQIAWTKLYGPMAFSWAVLAAWGAHALFTRMPSQKKKFLLAALAIPALYLLVFLIAPAAFVKSYVPTFNFVQNRPETVMLLRNFLSSLPSGVENFILRILSSGAIVTIGIFVWCAFVFIFVVWLIGRRERSKTQIYVWAIFAFTVFELWVYMPKLRDGFFHPFDPYAAPPYVAFLKERSYRDTFRVIGTEATFTPHLSELFEIQDFRAAPGVYSKRYWDFIDGYHSFFFQYYAGLTPSLEKFASLPDYILNRANINYVLSESYLPPRPSLSLIYDKEIKIYENTSAAPRVYVASHVMGVKDSSEARAILEGSGSKPSDATVEDMDIDQLSALEDGVGSARIFSYGPQKVFIDVDMEKEGFLVLADSFYPGWHALIDGKETNIYPANIMFRGVIVPSGSHTVTFFYQPWWFAPTVALSLLTLASCLLVLTKNTKLHLASRTVEQ